MMQSLITLALAAIEIANNPNDPYEVIKSPEVHNTLMKMSQENPVLLDLQFYINYYGLCLAQFGALARPLFYDGFYGSYQMGQEFIDCCRMESQRTKFANTSIDFEKHRVPYIHHQVWATNPNNPRELIDDAKFQMYWQNNMKILDESGHKWKHILWVNNKYILPKTLSTLTQAGYEVRDYSESPSYSPQIKSLIDSILADSNYAQVADFMRILVLNDFGGLYIDHDVAIYSYDMKYHAFTMFLASEFNMTVRFTMENMIIGVVPEHPAIVENLRQMTELLLEERSTSPSMDIFETSSNCFTHSWQKTTYQTGPERCAVAYNTVLLRGDIDKGSYQDILFDWHTEGPYDYVIDGKEVHFDFRYHHNSTGSWAQFGKDFAYTGYHPLFERL